MAPDLPLFLRGTPLSYQLLHTDITASALVALVLLAIWYLVLRPATRELSPEWLARRLPETWDATGRALWADLRAPRPGSRHGARRHGASQHGALLALTAVVSVIVGVVSHIVWDAFTHEGRWGVGLLPSLSDPWGPLLGYKWLQYGSGIVGVGVLAVAGWLWVRRRRPSRLDRVLPGGVRIAWWGSLPVLLASAWMVGLAARGPLRDDFTIAHLGYLVLPPACAVWGALTLSLAVVIQMRRRR